MVADSLDPATEAEWLRLRRQIELIADTPEFWLGFLFLPSPEAARVFRERATQAMEAHGRSVLVIHPETPDHLRNGVLPILFGEEAGQAGCVWVDAVQKDPFGQVSSPWGDAWSWLVLRMNERRDALRRHLRGGLVMAGPPEIKPQIRDGASDLWSVRSIVIDVEEKAEPDRQAAAVSSAYFTSYAPMLGGIP
jgi:hypothetical protein